VWLRRAKATSEGRRIDLLRARSGLFWRQCMRSIINCGDAVTSHDLWRWKWHIGAHAPTATSEVAPEVDCEMCSCNVKPE